MAAPTEVSVKITEKLSARLLLLLTSSSVSENVKVQFEAWRSELNERPDRLPLKLLKILHKWNQEQSDSEKVYLHELLADSEVLLPQPVMEPRNPELVVRLERLKHEQEDREYRKMTKGVDLTWRAKEKQSLSSELQGVKQQLIAMFNFVLTVVCSFVFGYKAAEYSLPTPHIPLQIFVGFLLALIVAIADLYFIIKNL
ncbi:PREDICTED: transmembrane protein 199-like [Priapulus caudatus]|uniref:Transmembrane protein 199-like n=1 Tax=Priapulus caudatus TaxID=37621 RepID=A0ABM1ERP8_PRICU|nr:PREDICTED: transmembrane protein 199-like [Priapulus caudatus]